MCVVRVSLKGGRAWKESNVQSLAGNWELGENFRDEITTLTFLVQGVISIISGV